MILAHIPKGTWAGDHVQCTGPGWRTSQAQTAAEQGTPASPGFGGKGQQEWSRRPSAEPGRQGETLSRQPPQGDREAGGRWPPGRSPQASHPVF